MRNKQYWSKVLDVVYGENPLLYIYSDEEAKINTRYVPHIGDIVWVLYEEDPYIVDGIIEGKSEMLGVEIDDVVCILYKCGSNYSSQSIMVPANLLKHAELITGSTCGVVFCRATTRVV